jgi:hypothetical protein
MPENDDILSRIGNALQSAWGSGGTASPSAPRVPRTAEVLPQTTGNGPGVKMVVGSHGYFPKAPRMAQDQELTRYTRAQQDDIKAADTPAAPAAPAHVAPGVTPQALAAALAFLQGGKR